MELLNGEARVVTATFGLNAATSAGNFSQADLSSISGQFI